MQDLPSVTRQQPQATLEVPCPLRLLALALLHAIRRCLFLNTSWPLQCHKPVLVARGDTGDREDLPWSARLPPTEWTPYRMRTARLGRACLAQQCWSRCPMRLVRCRAIGAIPVYSTPSLPDVPCLVHHDQRAGAEHATGRLHAEHFPAAWMKVWLFAAGGMPNPLPHATGPDGSWPCRGGWETPWGNPVFPKAGTSPLSGAGFEKRT